MKEKILTNKEIMEDWVLGDELLDSVFLYYKLGPEINSLSEFLDLFLEQNSESPYDSIKWYDLVFFFKKNNVVYYKNYTNDTLYNLNFVRFTNVVCSAAIFYLIKQYNINKIINPFWWRNVIYLLLATRFRKKLLFILNKNKFLKENLANVLIGCILCFSGQEKLKNQSVIDNYPIFSEIIIYDILRYVEIEANVARILAKNYQQTKSFAEIIKFLEKKYRIKHMEYQPEPVSNSEIQLAELSNLKMQELGELHNWGMQESGLLANPRPSEIKTASGENKSINIVNENVENEQQHDLLDEATFSVASNLQQNNSLQNDHKKNFLQKIWPSSTFSFQKRSEKKLQNQPGTKSDKAKWALSHRRRYQEATGSSLSPSSKNSKLVSSVEIQSSDNSLDMKKMRVSPVSSQSQQRGPFAIQTGTVQRSVLHRTIIGPIRNLRPRQRQRGNDISTAPPTGLFNNRPLFLYRVDPQNMPGVSSAHYDSSDSVQVNQAADKIVNKFNSKLTSRNLPSNQALSLSDQQIIATAISSLSAKLGIIISPTSSIALRKVPTLIDIVDAMP